MIIPKKWMLESLSDQRDPPKKSVFYRKWSCLTEYSSLRSAIRDIEYAAQRLKNGLRQHLGKHARLHHQDGLVLYINTTARRFVMTKEDRVKSIP